MDYKPRKYSIKNNEDKAVRILLGVSGSIAVYKSPDLVRRLKERGCEVRVVMTKGARAFVNPLTFQAVSGHPVTYDLLDPTHEAGMGHIELSRWADLILIAPTSANTISKLTAGLADDLLGATCLATTSPILLAPGMNNFMWESEVIQENLATLKRRGIDIMLPGVGELTAEGEYGVGRMPEPLEICDYIAQHYNPSFKPSSVKEEHTKKPSLPFVGKKVVITAGPTVEPIDPVRYLSNHSSGKMGYALAKSAYDLGAEVTLISGPSFLMPPHGVKFISIQTAEELLKASLEAVDRESIFIAAAAVADYRLKTVATEKIKKEKDETMTLHLTKNPDILSTVSHLPTEERPFCVGFAAETEKVLTYGKDKLQRKNLDLICINDVSGGQVFGEDENEMVLIDRNLNETPLKRASKEAIANAILSQISSLLTSQSLDLEYSN